MWKILEVIIAFSIFFLYLGGMIMTANDVLNNLKELIGKSFDYDDISYVQFQIMRKMGKILCM